MTNNRFPPLFSGLNSLRAWVPLPWTHYFFRLYVPVNNFAVILGGIPLSNSNEVSCLKGQEVRIEPATLLNQESNALPTELSVLPNGLKVRASGFLAPEL